MKKVGYATTCWYDKPFQTGHNNVEKLALRSTVTKSNPERPFFSFMSTRRKYAMFDSFHSKGEPFYTCSVHIGPYL